MIQFVNRQNAANWITILGKELFIILVVNIFCNYGCFYICQILLLNEA